VEHDGELYRRVAIIELNPRDNVDALREVEKVP
jgi:hypothetical protein